MNGKIGFINLDGKTIIPFEYEFFCTGFYKGQAGVKKEGKWGVINEKGEAVIPFEYDFVNTDIVGSFYLFLKGNKGYYIDRQGKIIFETK